VQPEPTASTATAAVTVDDPARTVVSWVDTQLDPAYAVAADPATRTRLIDHGLPASRTVPLDPAPTRPVVLVLPLDGDAVPPGSAGPTARSVPIADVPDGAGGRLEVRRAVPATDAVTRAAADRIRFGTALAANPRISLAPGARDRLLDGTVDPRLVVVLAGLGGTYPVGVSGWGAEPGATDDSARRSAVITTVNGLPTAGPDGARLLRAWVDVQVPAYRPEVTGPQGEPLSLQFRAPAPLSPLTR
jgi:hypothetical protein